MSGESEQFFTSLDGFVNLCAKEYPNKSFQTEISDFVSTNTFFWTSKTKAKLKENFEKKEVQEEFDYL